MATSKTDISIVIVNYKVKEYIANLLRSIERASAELNLQIFVVDNNSGDDSVSYLKSRFPEVHYIANKENAGFGKANNQAIKQAEGTYTLIINPDTLVSEDTLTVLVEHMKNNPKCGAAGCKILNPDGSFVPESKRSVPTIWTAFSKVTGLTALFPKSKWFGSYYLGWLDEDRSAKVPVLSGSFMFWRTNVLKELGGFDERFFMYGEDIDLCYRIEETGYHIDYVPQTSIIHYKGESTRKGDLRYIRIFNKALYQFFEKHHSNKYSFVFRVFIFSAIWLKTAISFVLNNLRMIGFITSDLILLNLSVILGFLIRFKFSYEVFSNLQNFEFLWINLLISVIYVIVGSALDLFRSKQDSISNQLKAIVASYAGVAMITFFVRDYAFSRLALIYGMGLALVLMLVFKVIQINLSGSDSKVTGRLKRSRILIVGQPEDTRAIKEKIHSRPDWNYEVAGMVSVGEVHAEAIGSVAQLKDMIKAYHIDQVFFALKSISYKDMLKQISVLQGESIIFKLIPDSMDFILGKSNVEYLESIPLVEVDFDYSKGVNRVAKRMLDISISLPATLILGLFVLPGVLMNRSEQFKVGDLNFYGEPDKHPWKNRLILFWYVLIGKLSVVGAPVYSEFESQYESKKGLTGLRQLNQSRIHGTTEMDNYELYYLQNYSIWMDIDILLKTLFNGANTLVELKNAYQSSKT